MNIKTIFIVASVLALASCGKVVVTPDTSSGTHPIGTRTSRDVESTLNSEDSKQESEIKTSDAKTSENHNVPDGSKTINVAFPLDKEAIDLSTNSQVFDQIKACFGDHLRTMTVNKIYADLGGVRFSSASVEGEMNLTFDIKIKSISVMAKPYAKKHYEDQKWYIDAMCLTANGKTLINTESSTSTTEPDIRYIEYSVDLNEPSEQLNLVGLANARPLISSVVLITE